MRWHPRDKFKWQRWFAWYPVECRCGTTVWMETVWYRRRCPRLHPDELFDTHAYAVFEERPDITEDGHIPENVP